MEILIKLNKQQEADLKRKVTREITTCIREGAIRIVEQIAEPHIASIKSRVRELTTDPKFIASVAAHVLAGKTQWDADYRERNG